MCVCVSKTCLINQKSCYVPRLRYFPKEDTKWTQPCVYVLSMCVLTDSCYLLSKNNLNHLSNTLEVCPPPRLRAWRVRLVLWLWLLLFWLFFFDFCALGGSRIPPATVGAPWISPPRTFLKLRKTIIFFPRPLKSYIFCFPATRIQYFLSLGY